MKVFVTGAAGRVGVVVADALAATGHEVISTDRRFRAGVAGNFRRLDLLDELAVHAAMEGCEVLVHLGNIPHINAAPTPLDVYRQNTAINVNVFQAAADHCVAQVIFASSIQVCSGRRTTERATSSQLAYLPLDGNHPPNPGNLYALSKLAGEELLRYYTVQLGAFSAVALRFPHIVEPDMLPYYRLSPSSDARWRLLDEGFSYLSLADAAALICALVERRPPGFSILLPAARGNKLGLPPAEVISKYYSNVPLRRPIEEIESLVDISEIERCCGWTPRENDLFNTPPAESEKT